MISPASQSTSQAFSLESNLPIPYWSFSNTSQSVTFCTVLTIDKYDTKHEGQVLRISMRKGRNPVDRASSTIDTKVVPITILGLCNLRLTTHAQKALLAIVNTSSECFEMDSQIACSPSPNLRSTCISRIFTKTIDLHKTPNG